MGAEPAFALTAAPAIARRKAGLSLAFATSACMAASDLAALVTVFSSACLWRHFLTPEYPLASLLDLVPCVGMLIAALYLQSLYPGVLLHPADEMRRVFSAVSITFLILGSTTFLWRTGLHYSRSVYAITWIASAPVILIGRYLTRRMCSRKPWWGVAAIVFGSEARAQRIVCALRSGMLGVRVVGEFAGGQVSSAWQSGFAQYAIVAMTGDHSELHAAQDCCRGFGHVLLVPDLHGFCSLGVSARELGGEIGLEVPQHLFQRSSAFTKRLLDTTAAALLLIAIAPLFLLLAAGILLTRRGPIFFSHPRRGRGGKIFNALKFRTMAIDGDRILTAYFDAHPQHRREWELDRKLRDDPRVTRLGKLIRRFSLDELPQLLNVVAGQMSLVGPRPIVTEEIEKYGSSYDLYSRVLPGITGLWQVSGRNNTTYEERVRFDEYYVRNWSVWLDLYILVRTVGTVLSGDGAY